MKKQDLLESYNINIDDEDESNVEGFIDLLIDYTIATQDEINLVCAINGYNMKSLLDILYVKTSLRSIEQLLTDIKE